jgi:hypothetical protein
LYYNCINATWQNSTYYGFDKATEIEELIIGTNVQVLPALCKSKKHVSKLILNTIHPLTGLFTGLKSILSPARNTIQISINNQYIDSRNNCNAIIDSTTNELLVGTSNTIIPETVTSIGENAF